MGSRKQRAGMVKPPAEVPVALPTMFVSNLPYTYNSPASECYEEASEIDDLRSRLLFLRLPSPTLDVGATGHADLLLHAIPASTPTSFLHAIPASTPSPTSSSSKLAVAGRRRAEGAG
ncbi:hypothetical protein EJB05_04095, partial [Eragrostis curvula]